MDSSNSGPVSYLIIEGFFWKILFKNG